MNQSSKFGATLGTRLGEPLKQAHTCERKACGG
jgi:hypothetical protein